MIAVIDYIMALASRKDGRGGSGMYVVRCERTSPQEALESLSGDWVPYTLQDDAMRANVRVAVNAKQMMVVVFDNNIWRLNIHNRREAFEDHVKDLDRIFWTEVAA